MSRASRTRIAPLAAALVVLAVAVVGRGPIPAGLNAAPVSNQTLAAQVSCARESAPLRELLLAAPARGQVGEGDEGDGAGLRAHYNAAVQACAAEGVAQLRSSRTCEQATEALTPLLAIEREAQLLGEDAAMALATGIGSGPDEWILTAARVCLDEALAQLRSAVSCERLTAGLTKLLQVARTIELVGESAATAEIRPAVDEWSVTAPVRCFDEAFERCHAEHDPRQAREMLASLRALARLGSEQLVDPEKVEKCLTFELDFESVMESVNVLSAEPQRSHVRATDIELRVPLGAGYRPGEGRLEWVSRTSGYRGCRMVFDLEGSTFRVPDFALEFPEDSDPRITMAINPGRPSDVWHLACPSGNSDIVRSPGHWWWGFTALHGSEGDVAIRDWTYVGGGLYARRAIQRSGQVGEGTYTETTTLELWHRPRR